jgi:hypothetical protein
VTDVCVIEVVVRIFYTVFEANTNTYPAHELFYLYRPLRWNVYIAERLLKGSGSSIKANLCPLDSIPVCSAIMSLIFIFVPLSV